MHELVKILSDDDGEEIETPVWHLAASHCGDPSVLCTKEQYGFGQSDCVYKVKVVKRGGITCQECMKMLLEFKSVKL
jgi:hypothetical protein